MHGFQFMLRTAGMMIAVGVWELGWEGDPSVMLLVSIRHQHGVCQLSSCSIAPQGRLSRLLHHQSLLSAQCGPTVGLTILLMSTHPRIMPAARTYIGYVALLLWCHAYDVSDYCKLPARSCLYCITSYA